MLCLMRASKNTAGIHDVICDALSYPAAGNAPSLTDMPGAFDQPPAEKRIRTSSDVSFG